MHLLRLLLVTLVVFGAAAANASATATINGKVFYDPPGQAPHIPVPGAKVEVRTMANAIVGAPLTTDHTGSWSTKVFSQPAPNGSKYKVVVTSPFTYVNPADGTHDVVQVFDAQTTSDVNFSIRGTTISGTVFNDIDSSGDKQPNEPVLQNAIVAIDGPIDRTVATDANGAYTTGPPLLPAGSYTATATKDGYTITTPMRYVNPAPGADIAALPSGLHFPTGTVTGDAYAETNGQPGRQAGEPPIAGVTVKVSGVSDGKPFALETKSGQDGTWSLLAFAGTDRTITASQPGAYLDGPESESAATGTAGADTFTGVTVPEDDTVGRFGFGETGATISGVTFSDRDGDGARDPGEPGDPGRKLALTATGFAAEVTTGGDGTWTVKGAPAGELTVTPETADDALTPAPRVATVPAGATMNGTDLGFRFGNLRGTVVNRQTGQPVAGVSVLLSGPDSRTVTTAANGTFEFPELAPGTYGVRADAPAGLGLGGHTVGTAGGTSDAAGVSGVVLSLAQLGTGYELGLTGAPITTTTTGTTTGTTPGTTGGAPRTDATPPAARDTTKPKLRLAVRGKFRRGGRVTLTVKATDPSGMRSVTIRAGKRRAAKRATLKLRLPRKAGRVKIAVKGIDKAGNATTLTRTLRVR